jgi:hypothetical protein
MEAVTARAAWGRARRTRRVWSAQSDFMFGGVVRWANVNQKNAKEEDSDLSLTLLS